MSRRIPTAEVQRSMGARPGTVVMPSACASGNASRRLRLDQVGGRAGEDEVQRQRPCRMGFHLHRRRLQSSAAAQAAGADRLIAKVPSFAKAFTGRWRIVEMDVWDNEFLDLVEAAHLTFKGAADGEIAFGALKGFLDIRYGARDGSACAEFSWEGHDENDPACGRGWAVFEYCRPPRRPLLHP